MLNEQEYTLLETIPHHSQTSPFSIYKTDFSPPIALYLHWHPEMELLYVSKGHIELLIDNTTIHLHEREAVFIPPNMIHSASATDSGVFYAFVFSPSLITPSYSGSIFKKYIQPIMRNSSQYVTRLTSQVKWQKEILDLLRSIFAYHPNKINENELMITGTAMIIWQYLFDFHITKLEPNHQFIKIEKQLNASLTYIHINYALDITLEQLAALSNLSEGQFCRSFKLLTNTTPFHYLNRYRILQSCNLLNNSDKKISEIASLCGFNNISYFNRKFVEIMNTTPSQYKKHST